MDKIVIDLNSLHLSNECDEISFNWCGNSIVSKLLQFENDDSPIIVKFDSFPNIIFFKFEQL